MDKENKRLIVAEIIGAHGVRGDMKIRIFAEDEYLIEDENGVFLSSDSTDQKRHFITLKKPYKKDVWLANMQGITTPEQIKAMGKTSVYILASALPEIQTGENETEESFYYHELEGLKVYHDNQGEKGKDVGVVIGLRNFGGGDLLEIRARSGDQFYHPFTKEDVPVLDIKNGYLTIIQREII